MRVLVTGKGGQLASEFFDIKQSDPHWTFLSQNEMDITDPDAVLNHFKSNSYDFVINCAAYTAVDKAEDEIDLAYKVNADGVKNLLKGCVVSKAKLIHYSTDYVFDGESSFPYIETDTPNPKTIYGLSKLKGEDFIQQNFNVESIIIRTSWVYSTYGKNFVKTMLKLADQKNEISVVADQIGSPTFAGDLAKDTITILNSQNYQWKVGDIFNYSNEGSCSWFDFAGHIFHLTSIKLKLNAITTKDYPTPAMRPKFSLLDKRKFSETFGVTINKWESSLDLMLKLLQ